MALSGERVKTDMGWRGAGPFYYTALSEPLLSTVLQGTANTKRIELSEITLDSVTFQPCLVEEARSQDRLFATNGDFGLLAGIFDGHGGHEMADHAVSNLPGTIVSAINEAPPNSTAAQIGNVLSESITSFDGQSISDVVSLFPNDLEEFTRMTPEDIHTIVNDTQNGGVNHAKILRGMRGSTALITLLDKDKKNLWIANLGDCQAILGTKRRGGTWETTLLTRNHNGSNSAELQAVRDQHPGEPFVTLNNRVLGSIAVTRALGDHLFKLPAIYTSKVFLASEEGFKTSRSVPNVILPRVLTPPYLSAKPDIFHLALDRLSNPPTAPSPLISSPSTGTSSPSENVGKVEDGDDEDEEEPIIDRFLILCSDGLISLAAGDYNNDSVLEGDGTAVDSLEQKAARNWVNAVGSTIDSASALRSEPPNLALALLRSALGGDNTHEVSRRITVEMMDRWMDDTTIQVIRF